MPSIESYQLLLAAAAACEDKKAEDIRILALNPEESGLSDYFLICNGTNDRQNGAISDEIEIRLKREFNTYPNAVEGRRQGEWILMDYVDFIVHIFSPEKRAFYGLERLRKSAVTVSTDQLTTELTTAMEAQLAPSRKRAKPKPDLAEPPEKPANRTSARQTDTPAKTKPAAKPASKRKSPPAKPPEVAAAGKLANQPPAKKSANKPKATKAAKK